MTESPESILLVTPVWNDSTRLAAFGPGLAKALAESELPLRWVIADDGSDPEEVRRLHELREELAAHFPEVDLHLAEAHRGKGSVIREVWDADDQSAWLSFVDCDGSTAAADMLALIRTALQTDRSTIAVRKTTEHTRVSESLYRSLFHHGYLMVVRLLLGLRSEDLQCGAKAIRAADYRSVSDLLEEEGFCFDTELLTALQRQGFRWTEQAINWTEKKGGRVFPLRDSWRMFAGVLRIRARLG